MAIALKALALRFPDRLLFGLLHLYATLKGARFQGCNYNAASALYMVKWDNRCVAVAHRNRLLLYRTGVERRLNTLADTYGLTDIPFGPGDLVIDCGANSGELGLWLEQFCAQYIGFEPDPWAYSALRWNVGVSSAERFALSNVRGPAALSLSTEEADSSLLEDSNADSIQVECITLDEYVVEQGLQSIRLLKIEAEGFEPEVLQGATLALKVADYVAVDVGPERYGESTFFEVAEQLKKSGFSMVSRNRRRWCVLFQRKT